ncbi:DUF7657 domain-containing protein [Achromobacter sp. UBA2119]|uniref:DUF7657 domain-containing protein n=1 Tax=Achromobacter sp. UBA2119 TaxID=1945911 RepID=UPI00257C9514|nr:hypothetical protein [Achromobacter sp. UBA2119]
MIRNNNSSVRLACLFFGLAILAMWLVLEPYPSHYLSGLRLLGDAATQNLRGLPKEGRGDEWSTYLPMLKQAALEGFPAHSALEPYKEKLNWFIALPRADFSLFFLPNFLVYWLVPSGKALSFQAFFYYALLIGSVAWYLRNLRVNAGIAVSAAVMLAFSHLYQVWWTSNFPALAASFLPFAILTSNIKPGFRYVLLFWAIGHMLFGQMYPPTYFALGVSLVPLTLAVRPDLLKPKMLVCAGIATAAALALYWVFHADFIQAVSNTSYPGRRLSAGGGSSLQALAAAIFPTLPVHPVTEGDPTYELSMVGTLFPLMLLPILPYVKWDLEAIRVTAVAGATLLILVVYATVGFPSSVAKWTGFFVMPGRRAHPGISLILLIYAAWIISRNWRQWRLIPIVAVLSAYALISAYVGIRPGAEKEFWGIRVYAYLPLIFVLLAFIIWTLKGRTASLGHMAGWTVLGGMALAHVVIFGSYNPIMRASDILSPVNSQLVTDWKALYEKNGRTPFAIPGNYGHLLRGEGLPAFEAIHLVNVNQDIYRKIFPHLNEAELDRYFNRFVGISFDNISRPEVRGATVAFELIPKAVAFGHQVERGQAPGRGLLETKPAVHIREMGTNAYDVRWKGRLNTPLPIDHEMKLLLPCDVRQTWLTRFPTPEPTVAASDGVALRGVLGVLRVVAMNASEAKRCGEALSIQ